MIISFGMMLLKKYPDRRGFFRLPSAVAKKPSLPVFRPFASQIWSRKKREILWNQFAKDNAFTSLYFRGILSQQPKTEWKCAYNELLSGKKDLPKQKDDPSYGPIRKRSKTVSQDSSSNESETSKSVRFKGVEETSDMETPTCPTCHQVIARDTKDYDSLMEKSVTMVTPTWFPGSIFFPPGRPWERTYGSCFIVIDRTPEKDLVRVFFQRSAKHVAWCSVCTGIWHQINSVKFVFWIYSKSVYLRLLANDYWARRALTSCVAIPSVGITWLQFNISKFRHIS